MTKLTVLALPLIALVAACAPSTSVDDGETTESSVTVTPGVGAATVTLHMPAGYDPYVPAMDAHFELSVNGTVVTPEQPTKVAWNTGGTTPYTCISGALVSARGTIATMQDCSVQPLQTNETRTISMSLLKLWWSNHPQVWANYVTPYAKEKVTLVNERGGAGWNSGSDHPYAFLGINGVAMPVVAGAYRYQIGEGVFEPFRFVVTEGTVADVNVGYDAYNSSIDLAFEERGGFADAPTPMLWLRCLGDKRVISRPEGGATQRVTVLDHAAGSCSIMAGGSEQAVAYSFGATTTVKLRRLNVDDVTLFDGTKSHGRYQVTSKNRPASAGATKPSPWNPTGTGLDLLPGEYQIDVWYAGDTRLQTLDVDLR